MIEVKTPKNILVYKTKVLGPLTSKQLICFVIAGILDFFVYQSILKPLNATEEIILYALMLIDVPILAFGYYEPMGLPLEKYLKMVYNTALLAPKYRKNTLILYKTRSVVTKKVKKSKKYKAYK